MKTMTQIPIKKKSNQFREQSLLRHKTIGELLTAARENSGVSRIEYAKRLKISEKYLASLEKGRYNDLPSPVYIKNYLRLYAAALGIRWEKIEERYQQEITVYHQPHARQSTFSQSSTRSRQRQQKHSSVAVGAHDQRALLIPRLLKIGAFGIVILILVVYFAWGVVRLLSPPDLSISNPPQDIIVTTPDITIEGQSEPEVVVEINGQTIGVNPEGHFQEKVVLRTGLNTIRVTAKSKLSREHEVIRHVLYDAQETESDISPATPTDSTENGE